MTIDLISVNHVTLAFYYVTHPSLNVRTFVM